MKVAKKRACVNPIKIFIRITL